MTPEEKKIKSRWPGDLGESDASVPSWVGDPNMGIPDPGNNEDVDAHSAPRPGSVAQAESIGVPEQAATGAEPVKEEESLIARNRKAVLDALGEDLPPDEIQMDSAIHRFLRFTGLGSLIAVMIALILLVVFSQALVLLSRLADLPDWARLPGIAAMAILCLILLVAMGRLLFLYLRFKRSPRLSADALKQMAERTHLRSRSFQQLSEAAIALNRILSSHPAVTAKTSRELANMGFVETEIDLLRENSRRLLETASTGSTEGWIDQYDRLFLQLLDKAARRRVRQYALRVGVRTAVVPTGFVDTSILLINAYQMIHDLCRIYGLRAGMTGTLAILTRVFFYAFAASRLEEWMDSATHQIMNAAVGGHDALMAAINTVAQGVVSRVAEGSANAFLLARLGAATIRYLRPLS